ncbi:MAG: mitochondrial carrier domain-containing protein [Olpidium bornovanus]|uniref:Mitochondrial carrier domain-containing protein n=1 Tax=Olpidium bornovanus TaxID=278681 RepID=A0A8H8DIJ0_9FUNG|nr:MAG: mitochondrial carrier domain-containing protein [Olpidium bornovanus]
MHGSAPEPNAAPSTADQPGGNGSAFPQLPHSLLSLGRSAHDRAVLAGSEPLLDLTSASVLSHAYRELDPGEGGDLDDNFLPPAEAALELLTYEFAKLCSAAVTSPFQVAGTLLQVQYLPSDRWLDVERNKRRSEFPAAGDAGDASDQERSAEEDEEDSELDITDALYTFENPSFTGAGPDSLSPAVATDHLGYVVPTDADVEDDALRPAYQLPPLEHGIWRTMAAVVKNPFEGWTSLWKGNFTFWLQQMLDASIQPNVEELLQRRPGYPAIEDEYGDLLCTDELPTTVTSHLISRVLVGWLLSPLDLVRTRLIVQSSHPKYRKYRGVYDCLRTTIQEEGGLSALFFDRTLLVPTVCLHAASALLDVSRSLLIHKVLGIQSDDSPLLHAFSDLAFSSLELLVTLPLETCRKRLQVQPSRVRVQEGRPFAACVQLRRRPYIGLRDCLRRIVVEEGGPREAQVAGKKTRRRRRGEGDRPMGLFGWKRYRGFFKGVSIKMTANITMFVVSLLGGGGIEEDL